MAEGFAPWCCPLCGAPLAGDNALKCSSGHSFDRAKEGYWHLLPVGEIKIRKHAAVIEGHILPDRKKRRH